MSDRKRNIDFMKDLLSIYNGQENKSGFRKEQISLIQELLALDYLNDSSFSFNKGGGEIWACAMTGEYPLTAKGREYIEMGWYRSLQQSGKYQLARDIAAFIGAAIGIIISIINHCCPIDFRTPKPTVDRPYFFGYYQAVIFS